MESDLVEETSFSAGSSGTSPRTSSSQSAITEENTIIESEPTVQTSDGPSENLTFPQIVVSTSLEILRKSSELLQQVLANSSSEFESKFLRETASAQLQGILENCQLRVNLMDDVNQWLNEQLSETVGMCNSSGPCSAVEDRLTLCLLVALFVLMIPAGIITADS